ncbi:chemokine XC receptor 1 [Diretmus argenteus]
MDLESDYNDTDCITVNGTVLDYCGDGEVEYLCDDLAFTGSISAALFFLIFIFSVTGNGLLLCVLIRYEDLKKVTNIFVLNLACSDLVFTLTLPFWAVDQLSHWIFRDFACKFLMGAFFVGLYSSVILLTAMTVDRFATVVVQKWPSTSGRRQKCAVGACSVAWVVSILASLSDAINSQVEDRGEGTFTCGASSTLESTEVKIGYYLQVSLLFFLPCAIIIFCYSAILRTILHAVTRKKHRTVVVVLCIVVAFFMCWAPYNVLVLVLSLYEPQSCSAQEHLYFAFEICRLLAYSHCCMNPVLYMLSQKFRGHLVHLLRCGKAQRNEMEMQKSNDLNSGRMDNVTLSHYSDDYFYDYDDLNAAESVFGLFSIVSCSLIFCLSVPGNTFLLWVLLRERAWMTTADVLLLHLTVSALCFTVTLPFWGYYHLHGWIFGDLACKVIRGIFFLGLYSYMAFLTAVTLDHYASVVCALSTSTQFLALILSRKLSWVARLRAVKNVRPYVPPPRLCRAIFKGSKLPLKHDGYTPHRLWTIKLTFKQEAAFDDSTI